MSMRSHIQISVLPILPPRNFCGIFQRVQHLPWRYPFLLILPILLLLLLYSLHCSSRPPFAHNFISTVCASLSIRNDHADPRDSLIESIRDNLIRGTLPWKPYPIKSHYVRNVTYLIPIRPLNPTISFSRYARSSRYTSRLVFCVLPR